MQDEDDMTMTTFQADGVFAKLDVNEDGIIESLEFSEAYRAGRFASLSEEGPITVEEFRMQVGRAPHAADVAFSFPTMRFADLSAEGRAQLSSMIVEDRDRACVGLRVCFGELPLGTSQGSMVSKCLRW